MIIFLLLQTILGSLVPDTFNSEFKDNLISYVTKNSKKVTLQELPDGSLRIVTISPIKRGEPVLVMNGEYIISTFESFSLMPYVSNKKPEVILMARILCEKFMAPSNTFTSLYVGLYPTDFHLYQLWNKNETDEFKANRNFNTRSEAMIDMNATYDTYIESIKGAKIEIPEEMKKWESWVWAYCIMTKYSLKIPKDIWKGLKGYEVGPTDHVVEGLVIIPLIERPPHSPLPIIYRNITDFNPLVTDKGNVYLLADRNQSVGSEFVYSHRLLSNIGTLNFFGTVVEKNIDNSFPLVVYKADDCYGTRIAPSQCEYNLLPFDFDKGVLRFFGDQAGEITEGYRRYREVLSAIVFKNELRTLRRELENEKDERNQLKLKYYIAEHVTYREHLKVLERSFMKELLEY